MTEQLKNKLQNFEVTPPPGAWKEIAVNLKESNDYIPVSKRMYDYEVAPPENVWKNILFSLLIGSDEKPQAPLKKINSRIYKITAAAAILGVVFLGGLYFFKTTTKRQIADTRNTGVRNKEIKQSLSGNLTETQPQPSGPAAIIADASDYISSRSKKNFNRESTRILRNAIVKNVRSLGNELAIMITAKPIRNERGDIIQNKDIIHPADNKYISITGPNGEQTRISSKFMNVLLYMNGDSDVDDFEGYFDKTFFESLVWKSRFRDWRNKILQTSFIPSSTNFLDILEFKDLITKDKENH